MSILISWMKLMATKYIAELIPEVMLNPKKNNDDYANWVSIVSTFKRQDIVELTEFYGFPLPSSFIYFFPLLKTFYRTSANRISKQLTETP